jgi:dihydroflavonol-4-reductase
MKILVTGATGFIGSHIIEELAKQGLGIRAAYRPGDSFQSIDSDFLIDGLDLESFALDVTDRDAVFRALKGCQILFHADYLFSFNSRDKARLYEINQTGTRNVMEAALANNVEKVVYTSGMETLLAPPGREEATEKDGVAMEDLHTDFEKSRLLAEREVLQFRQKGLPVIIVHPTLCVGGRERGQTPFGQYVLRYLQQQAHFYLDTGFNLVDISDVSKAHLLAAKRGSIGGRYILGNKNAYMLEVLQNLQRITGIKPPKTALPFGIAQLGNMFLQKVLRRRTGVSNAVINRLKRPLFFDSSLARQALGMPQSDVWEALRRQVMALSKNLPHHA